MVYGVVERVRRDDGRGYVAMVRWCRGRRGNDGRSYVGVMRWCGERRGGDGAGRGGGTEDKRACNACCCCECLWAAPPTQPASTT